MNDLGSAQTASSDATQADPQPGGRPLNPGAAALPGSPDTSCAHISGAEVKRPSHEPNPIPRMLARRGALLVTQGFIAVAPMSIDFKRYKKTRIKPGSASTHANDARDAIGEQYNKQDPKAGWKEAFKLGWRVLPCEFRVQL